MSVERRDFQRAVERFEPPQPAYERLLRRRDRKRRNGRITGLVVGLFLLALMGSALVFGSRSGSRTTPAGPTASPTVRPGPISQELLPGNDRWLKPGSHWLSRGDLLISFEVPSGWRNIGYVAVHTLDGAQVSFWFPDQVPTDPCTWTEGVRSTLASSVDGLAAALGAQPGTTAPADVTLAGYQGRSMQLRGPTGGSNNALMDCDETRVDTRMRHIYVRWWDGDYWFGEAPGQMDRLWILDVHGEPLVVVASWSPDTSPRTRSQIDDIVASIGIT
jgi:hypothetical protein